MMSFKYPISSSLNCPSSPRHINASTRRETVLCYDTEQCGMPVVAQRLGKSNLATDAL